MQFPNPPEEFTFPEPKLTDAVTNLMEEKVLIVTEAVPLGDVAKPVTGETLAPASLFTLLLLYMLRLLILQRTAKTMQESCYFLIRSFLIDLFMLVIHSNLIDHRLQFSGAAVKY